MKGSEASLSSVQYLLYLVSSSINVNFSYYVAGYCLDRQDIYISGLGRHEFKARGARLKFEGEAVLEVKHLRSMFQTLETVVSQCQ